MSETKPDPPARGSYTTRISQQTISATIPEGDGSGTTTGSCMQLCKLLKSLIYIDSMLYLDIVAFSFVCRGYIAWRIVLVELSRRIASKGHSSRKQSESIRLFRERQVPLSVYHGTSKALGKH